MAKLRVDKIAAPIIKDKFTGSVYFDGSSDYLSLPVSSDFQFGSGDFTIECWAYALDEGTDDILGIYNTGDDRRTFALRKDQTESVQFLFSSNGSSGTSLSSAESIIQLRTWHHYAVVRRNSVYEIYFDGVKVATKSDSTDAIYTNNDDGLRIGSSYNTDFHGYISNLRICKGHAVYTENFTPPTRELEIHLGAKGVVFPAADNRTVLLACQSSTDATAEATGRHILTANGNTTAADANPGLFRKTNITSTITENTGSVFFDGTDDRLDIASSTDFRIADSNTFECWINYNSLPGNNLFLGVESSYWVGYNHTGVGGASNKFVFTIYNGSSWQAVSSSTTPVVGTWYHLAAIKDGTSLKMFINGALENTTTMSGTAAVVNDFFNIGKWNQASAGQGVNGYLSNVRVCKGHAVYTSNFAPPTRELEVHQGPDDDRTVLLACYDGENIFADKSGRHIIAAYGDRLSSPTPTATDSPIGITTNYPPVTRNVDPTDGPTFQGGAGFTSQNWLTLPKGTTIERFPNSAGVDAASARGIISGGYYDPAGVVNVIEYLTISTLGNTKDFGDLSTNHAHGKSGFASNTKGIFAGGGSPGASSLSNNISYITIATTGDGKDFGDCITKTKDGSAAGNQTRGIFHAAEGPSGTTATNSLQYVTIQTSGNAIEFGDLTIARTNSTGELSSPVRGLFMGGYIPSSPNRTNTIDYVTISTTSNAVDFGDMTEAKSNYGVLSNSTRGIRSGGNSAVNTIDYITIATLGDAQDFGDLTTGLFDPAGTCASSIRGIIAGGYKSPAFLNVIQYVTISTLGNTQDFGDMTSLGSNGAGLSNGHGGLG